jgi:hypothetical protein
MGWRILAFLVSLLFPVIALNVYAVEENPEACDCHSVDLTQEEIAGGCTHEVKQAHCPLYRETIKWKERLKHEQEQRELEKRMEPRYIPR